MCLGYFKEESLNAFESIVLILLSTCSMLFMISAYDLIAMYLAIELQSLCFYVIAASKRDSEFSTEAGLKSKISLHSSLEELQSHWEARTIILIREQFPPHYASQEYS